MTNPTTNLTWATLPQFLTHLYTLPHNEAFIRSKNLSVAQAVENTITEIRSGSVDVPQPREFSGPIALYRAIGPYDPIQRRNSAYSGGWWFSEEQLRHIEVLVDQTYGLSERADTIRACLRQVTAVSLDWGNPMTEIWSLKIPPGSSLTGLVSTAASQPVHQSRPFGPKLVGGTEQVYFPVKNPLDVYPYA